MQGEVSVPCMDEDCGARAGAGAHVAGYYAYATISHVSPRMCTCDAYAELGVGEGYLQNIHLIRQHASKPRGLLGVARFREARRVGVYGPR